MMSSLFESLASLRKATSTLQDSFPNDLLNDGIADSTLVMKGLIFRRWESERGERLRNIEKQRASDLRSLGSPRNNIIGASVSLALLINRAQLAIKWPFYQSLIGFFSTLSTIIPLCTLIAFTLKWGKKRRKRKETNRQAQEEIDWVEKDFAEREAQLTSSPGFLLREIAKALGEAVTTLEQRFGSLVGEYDGSRIAPRREAVIKIADYEKARAVVERSNFPDRESILSGIDDRITTLREIAEAKDPEEERFQALRLEIEARLNTLRTIIEEIKRIRDAYEARDAFITDRLARLDKDMEDLIAKNSQATESIIKALGDLRKEVGALSASLPDLEQVITARERLALTA